MPTTEQYIIELRDNFSPKLKQASAGLSGFEAQLAGVKTQLLAVFGVTAIIGGITTLGSSIIKLGADMEQTRISFKTMLGSAEAANEFIKELQHFAKITPFDTPEVIDAGKQLLAFGFNVKEVIPSLRVMGDVASGLKIPMGDLIYLFGTLKAQGKVMTIDVRQFAQRGIPIYKELAKVMKVNEKQIGELVTDGKVGFKDIEKAFQNMTGAGSQFGGLMEAQSKSLVGQWSNFKAELEETGIIIGEKLLPYAKSFVDAMYRGVQRLFALDWSQIAAPFEEIYNLMTPILDEFAAFFTDIESILIQMGILSEEGFTLKTAFTIFAEALRLSLIPLKLLLVGLKALYDIGATLISLYTPLGKIITGALTLNPLQVSEGIDEFKKHLLKGVGEVWDDVKKFGATVSPVVPGVTSPAGGVAGHGTQGRSADVKGGTSKVDNEVRSGGVKNVVLNITKLVENINFTQTGPESYRQIQEMVTRTLLAAANDVNLVV